MFYTALLPTLAPHALPGWSGLSLLVGIHALLTLVWLSAYAHVLTRAKALFARPGVRRVLDRVTGVVLVAFAVRLGHRAQLTATCRLYVRGWGGLRRKRTSPVPR